MSTRKLATLEDIKFPLKCDLLYRHLLDLFDITFGAIQRNGAQNQIKTLAMLYLDAIAKFHGTKYSYANHYL